MRKLILILALLSGTFLHAELFFTPQMIATHLKGYSDEEVRLIHKDLHVVRSVCLDDTKNAPFRFYLATAGAPGALKTTILEKFVSKHPEYKEGVYLDPDQRTLKYMVHTYYACSLSALVLSEASSYDQVLKNAYDKWRGGSNYISLTLLEEAFELGRSITYGQTSTGGHLPNFYRRLKEEQYEIVLLLCSCPDEVRYQAVDYRNRVVRFYQSSPEDTLAKGLLFPQRMETYFAYANTLYFFWSDALFAVERLAAVWSNGKLEIHDPEAMQRFIDKYEKDRTTLQEKGITIPSFKTLLSNQ